MIKIEPCPDCGSKRTVSAPRYFGDESIDEDEMLCLECECRFEPKGD